MNSYKKFNTYGKLKSVMLGTYFYPEFFSTITDPKIRTPLQRIAHEINEDLEKFQSVLKDFGCDVLRAEQVTDTFNVDNVYRAPLEVRNTHCVIGDTLYQFNTDYYHPIDPILKSYCPTVKNLVNENHNFFLKSISAAAKESYNSNSDTWYSKQKYEELAGGSWPAFEDFVLGNYICESAINNEINSFKNVLSYETKEFLPLQSPNILNLDNKIYIDAVEYCNYSDWIKDYITDPRPVEQFTSGAGHIDGCFIILNSNTIIGIDPLINYSKYFPNHYVIKVDPISYQNKIEEFNIMKSKVGGKWWVANEEHNSKFINFVETNLKEWLGHVYETIFDVNVLVLDERTVCVSNITDDVAKEFKKRKIEYIVIPWRHRFFVDGGLHCITLDLYRE
jgi:hypothetical protein